MAFLIGRFARIARLVMGEKFDVVKLAERVVEEAGSYVCDLNEAIAGLVDEADFDKLSAFEASVIQSMTLGMTLVEDARKGMDADEVADVVAAFAAAAALRVFGPEEKRDDVRFFTATFYAMKETVGKLRKVAPEFGRTVRVSLEDLPEWLVDRIASDSGIDREDVGSKLGIAIPESMYDDFMRAVREGELTPDSVAMFDLRDNGGDGDDGGDESPEEMLRKFREGRS